MKKGKKNKFLLLSTLALTLFTLNGCNKGTDDDDNTTVDVTTIAELQAQSAVTIKFWHSFGENVLGPMNTIIENFKTVYPNVNVQVERISGGYDGLKTTLVQALPSGDIPNLALGYADHVADYLNSRAVLSLNPYMESTNPGVGFTAEEIADFIPGYLAEGKVFDNVNYYSLPFNKSTETLVYNKSVFDQLELTVPTTWDEVLTVTDTIKAAVANDIVKKKITASLSENYTTEEKDAMFGLGYDSSSNLFITGVRQWGGTYTTATGTNPEDHLAFNSQATKDMLTFFKNAYANKQIALPAAWEDSKGYCSVAFNDQRLFMTIGSTAGINNNVPTDSQGDPKFQIAAAPIPQKSESTRAAIQQGTNVSMLKIGNKYQKLASWLLIKHLTSTVHTSAFARSTGYLPVRTSAYLSTEYQAYLTPVSSASATIKARAAVSNVAYQQKEYYYVDPAFVGSSNIRKEVGLLMDAVMLTGKDVTQAINDTYAIIGT